MQTALKLLVLAGAASLATDAWAGRHLSQAVIARRELAACMTQRMMANRMITYYDAEALCQKARISRVVQRLDSDHRPAT